MLSEPTTARHYSSGIHGGEPRSRPDPRSWPVRPIAVPARRISSSAWYRGQQGGSGWRAGPLGPTGVATPHRVHRQMGPCPSPERSDHDGGDDNDHDQCGEQSVSRRR